ncbi:hypothetical protein [Aeromonas caviae]|uniref:hypothetical protein n=1 Tax=Aeromonas caviae TaxID=648 RepID=UPI00398C2718
MKWQAQNESGLPSKNGERYMEHHFHINDVFDSRRVLEGQLRECFGRVVYSHKTHKNCSDILLSRLSTIKLRNCLFQ